MCHGLIHRELTAVWLHKQADRLQLGFISCLIDYCWHNSCHWRKWWLTNDRAGSVVREITLTFSEATRQSSLYLSQCLFTATFNHCPTYNTDKTPANPFGPHGVSSVHRRHTSMIAWWLPTSASYSSGTLLNIAKRMWQHRMEENDQELPFVLPGIVLR